MQEVRVRNRSRPTLKHPTPRDQAVILEYDNGSTLSDIGDRLEITPQGVALIVKRGRQHLDHLELELLRATKTGQVVGLVVPHQNQNERQLAIEYFTWVVRKLRVRNIQVKVEHRSSTAGEIFFLSDVTYETEEGKST